VTRLRAKRTETRSSILNGGKSFSSLPTPALGLAQFPYLRAPQLFTWG